MPSLPEKGRVTHGAHERDRRVSSHGGSGQRQPQQAHLDVIGNSYSATRCAQFCCKSLLDSIVSFDKISNIVKDNRDREGFKQFYLNDPDREPELNWIFFRKYSPEAERNSLKLHHDTNMNTVNIALNDDYVGGGLFYLKPKRGEDSRDYVPKDYEEYDWIDSVRKQNASDVVFPDLHTGDAIFYNYTVQHAVAPVESGTRYSMAFFFDMDNPAVSDDFEGDFDSGDDDEDEDEYGYEDEEEDEDDEDYDDFKVELHNGLPDVDLDIVRVRELGNKEVFQNVFRNVTRNETVDYFAVEGDHLRVYVAGTEKVVSDFEVKPSKARYSFARRQKDDLKRVPLSAAAAVRSEL